MVASPFDLLLGRVIHAALRRWQAQVDAGAPPAPGPLLAAIREGAAASHLDRGRVERALKDDASGIRRYAGGPWPRRRSLFLEKRVRLRLTAPDGFAAELVLRIDRVAEYERGSAILDFKSVPPHTPQLRADRWQLRTYALAAAGLEPPPAAPLALFVIDVRHGRQLEVRASSADREAARNQLLNCARGVSVGDFVANGHRDRPCWSCGFRLTCPSSLSRRPPGPPTP